MPRAPGLQLGPHAIEHPAAFLDVAANDEPLGPGQTVASTGPEQCPARDDDERRKNGRDEHERDLYAATRLGFFACRGFLTTGLSNQCTLPSSTGTLVPIGMSAVRGA